MTKYEGKAIESTCCGELIELMDGKDYSTSAVYSMNMKPTIGHLHSESDEIYMCLRGKMVLNLFDPNKGIIEEIILKGNETLVIPKGVHHKIVKTNKNTILVALSLPGWKGETEHISDVLNTDLTNNLESQNRSIQQTSHKKVIGIYNKQSDFYGGRIQSLSF